MNCDYCGQYVGDLPTMADVGAMREKMAADQREKEVVDAIVLFLYDRSNVYDPGLLKAIERGDWRKHLKAQ